MTRSAPWIRHLSPDRIELYFPFDADKLASFKALIDYHHREWHDEPNEKFWSVGGAFWCDEAASWYEMNYGRSAVIAKGQLELFA